MLQYNGYNIRVIEKNDNEQLCGVIKGVFHELGLPLVGTAYADKDTLSMYEAYQDSRSIYYIVEKDDVFWVVVELISSMAHTKTYVNCKSFISINPLEEKD